MSSEIIEIDQSKDRHYIYMPIPFTKEQLTLVIKHCNGFENDPELVEGYVNHIIEKKEMSLNPSDSLGDGANVVDIFNFGFMAYMKSHFNIDVNPKICWWHPMSLKVPTKIQNIDFTKQSVRLNIKPNHQAMTQALNEKGELVELRENGEEKNTL